MAFGVLGVVWGSHRLEASQEWWLVWHSGLRLQPGACGPEVALKRKGLLQPQTKGPGRVVPRTVAVVPSAHQTPGLCPRNRVRRRRSLGSSCTLTVRNMDDDSSSCSCENLSPRSFLKWKYNVYSSLP